MRFNGNERHGSKPLLRSGLAIICFAKSPEGGHVWVIDGGKGVKIISPFKLSTFMYYSAHCNFGWERGQSNGWFGSKAKTAIGIDAGIIIDNILPGNYSDFKTWTFFGQ